MMLMTVGGFDEKVEHKAHLRLGALNGVLIGLALALGVWGMEILTLMRLPMRLPYSDLIIGGVALMLLGALAGWLSALQDKGWWSLLVWLLTAIAMIWVIGHMPYEGHDLVVWLSDSRFRGQSIYPFGPPERVRMLMTGFFILVMLAILGMLQPYRLETVRAAQRRPQPHERQRLVPAAAAPAIGLRCRPRGG